MRSSISESNNYINKNNSNYNKKQKQKQKQQKQKQQKQKQKKQSKELFYQEEENEEEEEDVAEEVAEEAGEEQEAEAYATLHAQVPLKCKASADATNARAIFSLRPGTIKHTGLQANGTRYAQKNLTMSGCAALDIETSFLGQKLCEGGIIDVRLCSTRLACKGRCLCVAVRH